MTLTLVLLWIVTVPLVVKLLCPRQKWFREVTSTIRPGTPEPTDSGYAVLFLRDAVLAATALAVTVPVTLDARTVTEDELYEEVQRAVALLAPHEVEAARVEAQLEVLLETNLRVDYVEETSAASEDERYYEIRATGDDVGSVEEVDSDAAVVCLSGTSMADFESGDQWLSAPSIDRGRCGD